MTAGTDPLLADPEFDWKRFKIPPKVAEAMDEGQQWAVTIAAEALAVHTAGGDSGRSALDGIEGRWPGLHFCANFRGGPGVSDCLDSAIRVSDRVMEGLATGAAGGA